MSESTLNVAERIARVEGTAGLAAHLGVSRWTVSRVLNGHAGVREETRHRVLDAVEELGFKPNRMARGLRGLPSGLVGVSFPYLEATILAEKGRVLQEELSTAGYRGIFEIPKGNPDVEAEVIRHFLSIQVEGVVLIAPTLKADDPVLEEVKSRGVGIVAVDPRHPLPVSQVHLDRSRAMVMILRHLKEIGHQRIAVLGLAGDDMYYPIRLKGLRKAARETGLRESDLIFVDQEGFSWREYAYGAALARQVLAIEKEPPTALICLNDRLAIGAMKVLHDAGKSIPGDYSIVGFDNAPESLWSSPSLTTIDQNILPLMRWVKSALWESIRGEFPRSKKVDPKLILRDSTDSPPVG